MLRDSFAKAMQLRIGESPTIYYGMESRNATDPATASRLKSENVHPGTELLYCGDRLNPRIAPQSLQQANCDAIATFRRGAPLGVHLHVDETECPMDSPNAEPECIDGRLDGGSTVNGLFSFLTFFTMVLCAFACLMCHDPRCRHRGLREGSTPLREANRTRSRQQGLSAEQMAALPRVRVTDGRASTCTVCFEPVDDGEEIFALRCGHRHHEQCLTDWLQRKSECPDCRGPIRLDDAEYDPPSTGNSVAVQPPAQEQPQRVDGGTTGAAAAAVMSSDLSGASTMDQLRALQEAQSNLANGEQAISTVVETVQNPVGNTGVDQV